MSFTEGPLHERSELLVDPPVAATVVDVPVQGEVVVPAAVVAPTAVATGGQVRRAYNSRFAPDAIIAAIAGLVILVVGLIAIVRGGFDGQMSDPVVNVAGFTHTTTLGLIEIVIGAALLISGATSSRSGAVFFGTLLGIGGFVGAVQAESFDTSLALESSMAWLAVAIAVVVVLSALLMPRFARQSTVVERI
jgi:asparagine N-glycosylation enzyme membrane subunit Stt3